MKCSKCGQENDAGAEVCSKCKAPLGLQPNLGVFNSLDVRTSVLGVLACLLGVLSLVVMTVSFTTDPARYLPILAIVSVAVAALAILCGIISLVCIEMSYGRLTGKAFAIIGIVAPLIPAVVFSILVVLSRPKEPAFRMVCGTNLSSLGKAMLIYSNDYADVLPRAAGPNSAWTGRTPNWVADNRAEAYGLDKGEGEASITASLYLLTKYAEVAPKTFLCSRGEEEATEFIPREYGVRDRELFELWDFGPDPARHCSYAYHMPYGQYALTVAGEPGMAVLADRNPFRTARFIERKDCRILDWVTGRASRAATHTLMAVKGRMSCSWTVT